MPICIKYTERNVKGTVRTSLTMDKSSIVRLLVSYKGKNS
jgi:hypothetical protein